LTKGSIWKNELGSTMKIREVIQLQGQSGYFTGTYISTVGIAVNEYELHGRFDKDGSTLGWVVSFQNKDKNANSTTTWSGRVQKEGTEKPTIQTTWILSATECKDCEIQRCEKHTVKDDTGSKEATPPQKTWNLQNIGFDKFTLQ
jgi:hypothetical protein